jgi:hypothetical protein
MNALESIAVMSNADAGRPFGDAPVICAQRFAARAQLAAGEWALSPRRPAAVRMASGELGAGEHDGTRLDDSAGCNDRSVENHGAVLDDAAVAELAGMDHRVLADRHVIADQGRIELVRDVHGRAGPQHEAASGAHVVPVGADCARLGQPGAGSEPDPANDGGMVAEVTRRRIELRSDAAIGEQVHRDSGSRIPGCGWRRIAGVAAL